MKLKRKQFAPSLAMAYFFLVRPFARPYEMRHTQHRSDVGLPALRQGNVSVLQQVWQRGAPSLF